MNNIHLPRSLVILLFILVIGTFIMGILRTFATARAATFLPNSSPTSTSTADYSPPGPTPTPPPVSLLPPPTTEKTSEPTPAPTLTPTLIPNNTVYADTTGIIALAILLVVVVLVGMAFGQRNRRRNKS
jgi:hypothetical protein